MSRAAVFSHLHAAMDQQQVDELVANPTETLATEVKSWLSPHLPEDGAKIAKALLALRNNNGGQMIFGVDDSTLQPIETGRPENVRETFHPDKIQSLVKDFAMPPFPVEVRFGIRDGKDFPVIAVPSGIKAPVICRKKWPITGSSSCALRENGVYIRTANNGRVQSTEPRSPKDWEDLMERCFDNREADVARFFRRHLPGIVEQLKSSDGAIARTQLESKRVHVVATDLLDAGGHCFAKELAKRSPKVVLPRISAWREVAVSLQGDVHPFLGQHLLGAVFPRHPKLSGWPVWIDSRGLNAREDAPYPSQGGWEALVQLNAPAFVKFPMIDFWRIDPKGEFYHRRNLEDDLWTRIPDASRGKLFDIIVGITRVAEAIATAQAMSVGLLKDSDSATLNFAFRWTGLRGRMLYSSEPGRDFFAPMNAHDDTATSSLLMPSNTASGALGHFVNEATKPLFAAFGYQVPRFVIDEMTTKTLGFGR